MNYPYGLWLRAEEEKVNLPPVNSLLNTKSFLKGPITNSKCKISSIAVDVLGHKRGHPVDGNFVEFSDSGMKDTDSGMNLNYKRRSVQQDSERE